jgi:curved DNA-binding protein CbpA
MKRGDIRDAAELKRRFRNLAKTCHPDVKGGDDGASFLRLRVEYEEALDSLGSRRSAPGGGAAPRSGAASKAGGSRKAPHPKSAESEAQGRAFDRREFYAAFTDLVASSFPADSLVKAESRGYRKLRERAIGSFSALGPGCAELFLAFERELESLYSEGILDALAGQVRMIVYNICSYHHYPTAFGHNALLKWREETAGAIKKRGLKSIEKMLAWLVDDLEKGAALG